VRFALSYCAVSLLVFSALLVGTNWGAYSTVIENYLFPESLAESSRQIEEALAESQVAAYPSDRTDLHQSGFTENAQEIKKQLEAEKVDILGTPYSLKSLIPAHVSLPSNIAITPYENRIVIPKIGKNIPLVDVAIEKGFDFDHMENIFMQELEKGVVRYPGTAKPGELGNAFVFGHSSNYPWLKGDYNDVFALLDELVYGDQIIVYYGQKKFTYTIREKRIVRPGDVKVLERDSSKKELSLMTCWPLGTTINRLIVFAELTK
jgi:LPXTG-site transpeptidase (sortase) family protein